MKRPFLWYAGAYVLGEVLAFYGLGAAALLGVLLLSAGDIKAAASKKQGQSRRVWLALPFFFLAGLILVNRANISLPLDTFFEITGKTELDVEITGTVMRIEREGRIRLNNCEITFFDENSSKEKMVFVKGVLLLMDDDAEEGNRIRAEGKLYAMEEPGNPGEFDSRAYYRAMGISYMVKGTSGQILSGKKDYVRLWSRKIRAWMSDNLGKETGGLFRAMVLGEKWEAEEEIKDLYTQAGIGHLMTVSGLHVSLAGMGLYRLLRERLKHSYLLSVGACILASFGYYLLTGEGTSAARAFLMLSIYGLGELFGRQYDLPSAAALAALIILVKSPLLLFQSGFQLSFGSVLALGLLYPRLRRKLGKTGLKFFLPGLSVFLVTFPIQAFSFYKIPVYSLILNVIVVPSFFLVAVSGIIGSFLGGLFPGGANIILFPSRCLLLFYEALCRESLKLPGALWRTGKPEGWQLLLYGIFLVTLFRRLGKRPEKDGKPSAKYIVSLSVFIVLGMGCLRPVKYCGLELTFLDVGQGDCCFIRTPEGITFLIDGGSSSGSSVGKYSIAPFLDSAAVEKVDYVLISHGDEDHINGIRGLMAEKRIGSLVFPKGQAERQDTLQEMWVEAEKLGMPVYEIGQGERICSGEVSLNCLWPAPVRAGEEAKESDNKNEASMVLWLSYGEFDVLFTGDLEGQAEEQVTQYLKTWQRTGTLEILKAGHHGSKNGSSRIFLEETEPVSTIISCGKNNRYGHPSEDVLKRLEAVGSTIYRTDETGAVVVKSNGGNMEIYGFLKVIK